WRDSFRVAVMPHRTDILIVGAGQGGAQTAVALRQQKFAGSIVMLGAEPALPYERPALSKECLAGDKAFDSLLLRPPSYWSERNVEVRLGQRVMAIDEAGHQVSLADGDTIQYGKLVWAAGGRPRRLGCADKDLGGVHFVRERAGVDLIRAEVETTTNVVVIGGGDSGLEGGAGPPQNGKHAPGVAQDRP